MLRASSYNILIAIPHSSISIIVNGTSGSIDAVDTILAQHLVPDSDHPPSSSPPSPPRPKATLPNEDI
jgi:hypothetical protein